jgi:hypothetical protein
MFTGVGSMRPIALMLVLLLACANAQADWRSNLEQVWQQVQQNPQATSQLNALTDQEVLSGLREALAQGTTTAINSLGRTDGFWKNAAVRIPLPDTLTRAEGALRKFGGGPALDEFQLTLNRAAEKAVPQVADIFGNAVRKMTIDDARGILAGAPDAATQFFRKNASDAIYVKVLPLVTSATRKVGVTQQYKSLVGSYGPFLQLAGIRNADLDSYVTNKAMDGLFSSIAAEEANIRANPAARGTEILRKVFSK